MVGVDLTFDVTMSDFSDCAGEAGWLLHCVGSEASTFFSSSVVIPFKRLT